MAVTAYVGEPGAGKTYEVVTEVVIPALREGRRVVSNIRGLNFDEIKAYLVVELQIPEERVGAILIVDFKAPAESAFWYTEENHQSVVQPGDLVVLDEVWRWCGKGMAVPREAFEFCRMHRQFTNSAGTSCDLVLISQSMQDIDNKVKLVIEKHFRMEKYKIFGSKKKYSVEAFNGYRISNNQRVRVIPRQYDPKFFPMYKSYAGKGGDEKEVDKRINILRSPYFLVAMPLAGVFIIVGLLFATRYFTRDRSGGSTAETKEAKAAAASVKAEPVISDWRAVGFMRSHGSMFFVVELGGHYRYIADAPDFRIGVLDVKVPVDGKPATGYVGGAPGRGVLPGTGAK